MKKSNYMQLLALALTVTAAAAWGAPAGQTAPGGDPAKAAARQELKDLNFKEKAELQAVNASNVTAAEKKAARQKIRSSYRRQRQALRQKYLGNAVPRNQPPAQDKTGP